MESELSPDDENDIPPLPIKTYQWEDIRRAREAGGYPWTHLLKVPLEGEVTAEDIIRESTRRRSMSREVSRSRTRSPADGEVQKILNLDSSPGSSRRHGEEGEDEGMHIPNFSKEVSLEEEDVAMIQSMNVNSIKRPESESSSHLATPLEIPKNVSPKGILKRRVPEQQYSIGVSETRENTKCCHPLVNKIKHLADKTLHKLERSEHEKTPQTPLSKRKKNDMDQEIRQLKTSPSAVRRQKFSAIKLGDSDEMSKTLSLDTPPPRKKKEHIYEDIEDSKGHDHEKTLHFSHFNKEHKRSKFDDESKSESNTENESLSNLEKKSIASQDPSLITEDTPLKTEDLIMEKLHKVDNVNKEALLLDEEMDAEEPNVDEIFQNQLDDRGPNDESPNITITEITEDDPAAQGDRHHATPIESSPSPSPQERGKRNEDDNEWSKPSSDHEYEIIEKPQANIVYNTPNVDKSATMVKTDDELSSTTSLERKYLQHTSDEEELNDDKENHESNNAISNAEALQKDIEDRFFVNTPSTASRTECEVSTSQVDSSALEQLPLKRDSRSKHAEGTDNKFQQRIREGTGKLKTQAGKLKTKLQSIKTSKFSMPDRPKLHFPDRSRFKMPERPKITFPDRPKFTMPDRRKFSLPDRPKFKKINISEKLSLGDRKKFTLPERPRFNVPDMPRFRMPDRPKINFPSLGRKKENKTAMDTTDSTELDNVSAVEFENRTYPRWFSKKKKSEIPKTSSSPTLNREDTPPPTFTFTRVKKNSERTQEPTFFIDSSDQPREYGNVSNEDINDVGSSQTKGSRRYDTTYDFDKLATDEYVDDDPENPDFDNNHTSYIPDSSPSKQDHTPVITEINNDEFFVRPRGISREDIQVREYLNDETRQAFNTPKNILALMGSSSDINDDQMYMNDPEADPELIEDIDAMYPEDLNDKDDGYYTFPPVRPSRAKRKKKLLEYETDLELTQYIDDIVDPSTQFTEVDLSHEDQLRDHQSHEEILHDQVEHGDLMNGDSHHQFSLLTDLHSIHEYANDDVIQYPENVPIQSQTLPMPPRRKRKFGKKDMKHSSLSDFNRVPREELWEEPLQHEHADDIIVYRTEHEYIVPRGDPVAATGRSPVPPRRTSSRSSRATSLCDDDRTSHGADSLTLDTHMPHTDDMELQRDIRHESPGYAIVDKGPFAPPKGIRRSISRTPPARRRKSDSSERKYYTVGSTKNSLPDRPPRKKSSTSLMTLDSFTKHSDVTQYVEIDEPLEELHKNLQSGDVVNKMKDRPLPPPPRPPRGSRKKKKSKGNGDESNTSETVTPLKLSHSYLVQDHQTVDDVIEIEVSTQTDPLPDDVDFELGYDENLDMSMSSSLRDIIDDDSILAKSHSRLVESPRVSRPTSRSEPFVKLSDPKISELSKPNIGRTSPTVILVEKRVSSPTRINECHEMVTEASLTVQPIDIDESQIPDVPPLPRSRCISNARSKDIAPSTEERALERILDASRDIQLDNLITQRLQVRDLDVGRLNVSELQANKILVSDIEGMTLQVSELDSKSGHISVSGIEFSQSVIDEIVKKFAEISTSHTPAQNNLTVPELPRPVSREEETQTEQSEAAEKVMEVKVETKAASVDDTRVAPSPSSRPESRAEDGATAPQRPPPPDLTPLLYSYLQDMTIPPASFLGSRMAGARAFPEFHEPQPTTPLPPTRRVKRKPAVPPSESSSDEALMRPSPRRLPPPVRAHEPTIVEAGAQFLRVCHSSISRTIRNMFNVFMSYVSGTEDKKDAQMALVIFLVLIAGLIMFGLSDSRAVHHHHWEFFNPPDGKQ